MNHQSGVDHCIGRSVLQTAGSANAFGHKVHPFMGRKDIEGAR